MRLPGRYFGEGDEDEGALRQAWVRYGELVNAHDLIAV